MSGWGGKESQLASLRHELLSEWRDGMHVEVVLVEVYVHTARAENILSCSSSVTYNYKLSYILYIEV